MRALHWTAALGIAGLLSAPVNAADTGIYAGLSVGQVRTDLPSGLDDVFDDQDTAFKLVGGWRILEWLGVEVSYVDLGEITQTGDQPFLSDFRLELAGFNAFGVLYYDIAMVDLFAKGGLMQTQAHTTAFQSFGPFLQRIDFSDNTTDLAWGVGAQARFGSLAVRLEYERFELDTSQGIEAPQMISLGATWTFF
jgi:OmpA-OmpF porin, OOP family